MGELLPLLGWFTVVVGVLMGGYFIIRIVRRWAQREEKVQTFTFQDLREMRARGQITEEEFARMRAAVLDHMDVESPSKASPPGPTSTGKSPTSPP